MRYDLFDFQDAAAAELFADMNSLMTNYEARKKPGSCCLAAPTGSGKTVIAASVIEALMYGGYDVEPDENACVLWVTDLPSLAEQTKERLLEATDLEPSRIETVTNTFTREHEMLEAGQVYFLHRQLLGKGKLLTRGGEARTFWQVLRESIDSGLHLYLFLDEAHRGIGSEAKKIQGDATIYAQLIDGYDGMSPVPVVVGISATPKRYLEAMEGREGRTTESPVSVRPADVQASGLLKDDIVLMSPKESSAADMMYLDTACKALTNSNSLWSTWCTANGVPDVRPLMVVQVDNKESDKALQDLAREISERTPWLGDDAFAHVFGDHEDRHLRGFYVPYLSPESIEQHREVRVLFAKEAISTGWDCPRAEVLLSMRRHSDITYITQLLGRMLRTPLARRIEGLKDLNAVRCYLPRFDEKAVLDVRDRLTQEGADDWSGISEESGRHVYDDPVDVTWNEELGIDEAFESVIKRVESHHPTKPIEAAYEYADLLAEKGIDTGAHDDVRKKLLAELRSDIRIYEKEFDEAVGHMSKLASVELHFQYLNEGSATEETHTQDADAFAVEHARTRADHALTRELTNAYFRSEHGRHVSDMEVNVRIAAAASVPQIVEGVEGAARERLNLFTKLYRDEVNAQPEPIRACFASVLSRNGIHRDVNLRHPQSDIQDHSQDTYVRHVLSNPETKEAYLELNGTEAKVVSIELRRGCIAFYRNPSTGIGEDVLSVIYQKPTGGHYTMHPDFLFFDKTQNGIKPSIIDPHGEQYSDGIPKMRGLCDYVEGFGDLFNRVWSVDGAAERYVDLKDAEVRAFIRKEGVIDADEVFTALGKEY